MAEQGISEHAPKAWWDLSPKRRNLLSLVLLFLISLGLLTKIFTSDFGTHIALGRQIVETRSVTDKEFLNYPSLGMRNVNTVWGFQTILYLVFSAGGTYGVSFFIWAVVFGILLLIYRSTTIRGADPLLTVAAIFAFSGFLRIRIQPRPELLTYLFIALTIYLFSEYFYGTKRKRVWLFPAVMLIWANLHSAYLIGFILCGAFLADALARSIWNRQHQWPVLKGLLLAPVLSGIAGLVVCGLNPSGYDSILAPLQLLSKSGGTDHVQMMISELTPVKGTGFYSYYKAAAAFAAVTILLGAFGRRLYLLDIFLFAISFKGAWDSARAVSMMGLFLSPGASLQLTGFLARMGEWLVPKAKAAEKPRDKRDAREKGKKRDPGRESRKEEGEKARKPEAHRIAWGRVAVTAVTVVALAAFGGTTMVFSFGQLQYGVGLTEHKFSLAAAEFLRKNPVPGNMFNFFDIGGFLDWQLYPKALTFIDGRTYNGAVFMEHQTVTAAFPGWENILDKYGVTYIVTKAVDSAGMTLPIIPALANNPNWSLVFADGLFVVFVRNTPGNREYLQKFSLPKSMLWQQVIWESYHYMYLGVSPVVAYQNMGAMYEIMGNYPMAVRSLQAALREVNDPYIRARIMQLEQASRGR
ncbi:MAG: hypothetical protein HY896_14180 [Deltaproteobacteria bacterium]|nr:hypothetical protein [Deltaproteobacteria bacterium]